MHSVIFARSISIINQIVQKMELIGQIDMKNEENLGEI